MAKPKVSKNKLVVVDNNDEVSVGVPTEELNIINPQLNSKLEDIKEKKDRAEKEEIEIDEEVSLVTPLEPIKPVATMVKVKLAVDHRCFIGGEWYTFTAGKQYNVPTQVKEILLGANLLLPI